MRSISAKDSQRSALREPGFPIRATALEQFEATLAEVGAGAEREALARAFAVLRENAEQPIRDYGNRCARLLEAATREEN